MVKLELMSHLMLGQQMSALSNFKAQCETKPESIGCKVSKAELGMRSGIGILCNIGSFHM
jgi:hypothetical protein